MTCIFTLNGGSSSIKFSVYDTAQGLTERASGKVDELGSDSGRLVFHDGRDSRENKLGKVDHEGAMAAIIDAVRPVLDGRQIAGIGHRIVHGGPEIDRPVTLDKAMLTRLERYIPFAPLHQPFNLQGVRAAMKHLPDVPQIGCFDTAFHRGHPWVNDTFALPRRYYDAGIRRYGFHGLSYTYIADRLSLIDHGGRGRAVVAHLGNGASICAIEDGAPVASTMGFSALDGLAMGTRCGQIDPGVILYMADEEGLTTAEITRILYKESGLLGLSGISSDMRALEDSDRPEAAQAITYFVSRIRRELGAMAACLGGIDTLVFTGGIGENSATIRNLVCEDMEWLGITLDQAGNKRNDPVISTGDVVVRVIPTNEELVIAEGVASLLPPPVRREAAVSATAARHH
ncbi:acetate/propionate family kinase [Paracoccus sp. (in: a-proteobacteria)]|uniref:acetate/propionate family kinase n=1 Tax=Paracoccus sp. TaxID=267 RepID=UPI003A8ADE31